MDNLTHTLVGLAAAKAGLERLSPAATAVCIIAANAPDGDIVALFGGRWAYLHHHRGITHSIVGTLVLALLIPTLIYLGGMALARVRRKQSHLNWRGLILASLIVSATHPLMDWTNNYGVRPLLPWSAEWYYGDLVFIIDPYLWLSLGGAAFLLTAKSKWRIALWTILALVLMAGIFFLPAQRGDLFYPAYSRVLWVAGLCGLYVAHRARIGERWGKTIPLVALSLVIVYWGGLSVTHNRALQRAQGVARELALQNGETIGRVAAMPTLANPLLWRSVAETNRATYRFNISLSEKGKNEEVTNLERYELSQNDAALIARAAQDYRAKIFLDFARFPTARVERDCLSQTLVQFADLRYTEPGGARRGSFSLEIPVERSPETGESKEQ